jgi:phosphoketolase
MTDVMQTPAHLHILAQWMRSYTPEELFDGDGVPVRAFVMWPRLARSVCGAPPMPVGVCSVAL